MMTNPLDQPAEPWLQVPGETDKQYYAFTNYLNQGRGRTVTAAYRSTYGKPTAEDAPPWFREWSQLFMWDRRARSWDEHVEAKTRAAMIATATVEAEKRTRDQLNAARGMIGAGTVILSKAKLAEIGEREARRLLQSAGRLVSEGIKLERLLMGEPDSITAQEVSGPHGAPVRITHQNGGASPEAIAGQLSTILDQLSPEARTAVINDLEVLTAAQSRLAGVMQLQLTEGEPTND